MLRNQSIHLCPSSRRGTISIIVIVSLAAMFFLSTAWAQDTVLEEPASPDAFASKSLSNATCVQCHFHVPKQASSHLSHLAKLLQKGYVSEQGYRDALKRHTHAQQCAECHEATNQPQGQCTRGDGCLRDVPPEKKVAYLGVSVGAVPAAVRQHVKLSRDVGLMIESVEPDSPAAEAKLRVYDILEKLDRQLLVNQEQFSVLIKMHQSGEAVSLELIRANEPIQLTARLGERIEQGQTSSATAFALAALAASNEDHTAGRGLRFLQHSQSVESTDSVQALSETQPGTEAGRVTYLGVNTSPLSDALMEQLKLPQGLYLVIDSVLSESPAAAAGLRPFDVLQKLDDQLLVNAEQLTVLIRNRNAGDEAELTLIRDGQPLKLRAKLGEHQDAHAAKDQEAILADLNGILTFNVATTEFANATLSDAVDLSIRRDVKDEEYVRRVYLDLTGTPPSPKEVEEFVSGGAPNKRQQLIDRLLSRPDVIGRIRDSVVLEWSDREHSLVLAANDAGQKRLLAKDKQGSVLFDGLVDSDRDRQQLDPRLAAKLELMLKGLTAAPALEAPADGEAALEKVLLRFQAEEETLAQLLERLRRETGANIIVDRKALVAAGVTLDDPLSLDLHDVRGRTVLKMLLTLASGSEDRLTFEFDDGVVVVTAPQSRRR